MNGKKKTNEELNIRDGGTITWEESKRRATAFQRRTGIGVINPKDQVKQKTKKVYMRGPSGVVPETDEERLKRHKNAKVFQKVKEFLKVSAGPKVKEEVFQFRLNVCKTVRDGSPCEYLKQKRERIWCGACGCGFREAAELNTKLQWARVECPAGYFDKINEKTEMDKLR
jgi:predicted RNA-binding Zn ribbon-like protein